LIRPLINGSAFLNIVGFLASEINPAVTVKPVIVIAPSFFNSLIEFCLAFSSALIFSDLFKPLLFGLLLLFLRLTTFINSSLPVFLRVIRFLIGAIAKAIEY